MPFISVVIPSYNSEKYIAETLKTVFNQTYNDYEIIVSDDGSSDNTLEIVKDVFRKFPDKNTKLLINKHEGPGAARNRGIEAASGKWVSFLDSDDRWLEQKLQKVVDFISCNSEINLVCHSEIWHTDNGEKMLDYSASYNKKINPFLSFYRQNCLSTSAVTVKREFLIKAGMFDESLPSAQDYDLWLRLSMLPEINIGFIKEPLGFYITRDGNISSNVEQRLRCVLKIGQKYADNIKQVSSFPIIERLRYEGRFYTSAGLELIHRKNFKKGILFLISGLIRWPFRFDLIAKLLKEAVV
jgi:glycosyltransferase involved in cell wall biosynthesis